MSASRRVLFGAALIALLTVVLLFSLRLAFRLQNVVLLPVTFIAGAAVGGAAVMRREGAHWPEPVYAGLVSTLLLLMLLRVAFPGMGPTYVGDYPGAARDQAKSFLAYFVVGGAGVFMLPMFDSVVRREGPRPSVYRIALTAVLFVVLVAAVQMAVTGRWGGTGYPYFGLGIFVAGSVAALITAGLGILLTLVGAHDMGAWCGGLGLWVGALGFLVWLLTGMRWFP